MMRALGILAQARAHFGKPDLVVVTLGNFKQYPWWKRGTDVEIVVPDAEPVARMDFRPVVGCDVLVFAAKRDDRLRQIVERICSHASLVTVLTSADPDDLGHVWQREKGWRRIGERRVA